MDLSSYLGTGLYVFVITMGLLLIAYKVFPRWGMVDRPEKYGLNRAPIPYFGGVVIYLAFLISVLALLPLTEAVVGLLISGTIIAMLGFLDDLFDINPFVRLGVQLFAAFILAYFGIGIFSINIPLIGVLNLSFPLVGGLLVMSVLFTILWVMAIVNTMNFVDGVGGLCSGVSFIAGITLFVLSVHPGIHTDPSSQEAVAILALILAAISFAFLLFDFPRPRFLMGDSGSTFLGFLIATLAIFSGGKVATAFLVLGLPILDMIWVVFRRIFSGKKFWKGDMLHLHHRFLELGMSERKVVTLYLLITAFFGVMAVTFVSTEQKLFEIVSLVFLMIILGVALVLVPRRR